MQTLVSGRPAVTFESMANLSARVADPFERLFLHEYPKVVAVAHRVLGDRQAAEDVAQEVFLQFHRRHAPAAPYAAPWLHAAAAHSAINLLRSERRRARRETVHASASTHSPPHPEEAYEAMERRRRVRAALAKLTSRSAAALALRYSGFSYAEVAAALGVRVTNVGTILRRAERALRKEVERETSG